MSTPDGIGADDWDVVHQLALDCVNAPDDEKESVRHRLLVYLDTLEARYGSLPSILATRADYLDSDDPKRLELLLRAYELAESRRDRVNALFVAHSLAELHLENRQAEDANRWLSRMRERLADVDDHGLAKDYERLREDYRRLLIVLASESGASRASETASTEE
jgi:hypothetical protein